MATLIANDPGALPDDLPPEDTLPEGAHPRLTLLWLAATLVLFVGMVVLGILMRGVQANVADPVAPNFYAFMTLHGLGMAGAMFVGAMACSCYYLGRYVRPSAWVSGFALAGTLAGVVILAVSTLYGGFAAGWYFLHPLPFSAMGGWPIWSAFVFLAGLTTLGVSWLVWCVDGLRAIAARYPLPQALGWHYITGKEQPEVPPIVLITTVALVALFGALVAAVIVVALFLLEYAQGKPSDPLLMKNLTFFFGHTLVNITMYLGVGVVYELFPEYCGRPWKANRVVAISWNVVLLLVMVAYLHHLYMDFAQPPLLQALGQVASYMSALPAAVVSIYGGLIMVIRARMRWTLTSTFLFLGLMGWSLGGIAAVTDSTIMVNLRFHNTLWVPGHFHTYMLLGVCLMMMGAAYRIVYERAGVEERPSAVVPWLFLLGGYGFVAMFYAAGADGIPRRYATYPDALSHGATYARIALGFIAVYCVGLVGYLWKVASRWPKAFARS